MIDSNKISEAINNSLVDIPEKAGLFLAGILKGVWLNSKELIIIIIFMFFVNRFLKKGTRGLFYSIFYFSILSCVIYIKGWSIVFNDYFKLLSLVAYIISFELVGCIFKKNEPFKKA